MQELDDEEKDTKFPAADWSQKLNVGFNGLFILTGKLYGI